MGFNIEKIVQSEGYKNFMSKLYGIGASVVILGAMFKIQHWPGAGPMLVIGLSTEAVIFFFSAFEPPHETPDWSLVYPELAGHNKDSVDLLDTEEEAKPESLTGKLDKLLNDAGINPDLMQTLSIGMKNLGESASKLKTVSEATVANEEFVANVKSATSSAGKLSESYINASSILNNEVSANTELSKTIKDVTDSAKNLSGSYKNAADVLSNDIKTNEEYVSNLMNATKSAKELADQYKISTQKLAMSSDKLDVSNLDNAKYLDQIEKMSNNLMALNSVYELQLKNVNNQTNSTAALNESVILLKDNLDKSVSDALKFKEELSKLNDHLSSLNNVYGNMLTAMTLNK